VATAQWQTPSVADTEGTRERRGGERGGELLLKGQVGQWGQNWPTPAAGVFNDGESPESWRARAKKLEERHHNGNGAGVPLSILAQEWATPTATDWKGPNADRIRPKGNRDLPGDAKAWSDPTTEPPWTPCPCCETFVCTIHETHAHDCPCPSIEEWETDPYSPVAQEWATPDVSSGYRDMSKVDPKAQKRAETHRTVGLHTQAIDLAPGPASRPDPATATAGDASSPPTPTSLQLNQRFVSVLMGLSPDWVCACARGSISSAPSATPSCPNKPSSPCACSGAAPSAPTPAEAERAFFQQVRATMTKPWRP
jgi:hypothetical protein